LRSPASRCAAAAASLREPNSAKHVAPDPDILAEHTPRRAAKGRQDFPDDRRACGCGDGQVIVLLFEKFDQCAGFRRHAGKAGPARAPLNFPNTSRVASATPGFTRTAGMGGRSSGGDSTSPIRA
jgi:hypothetical protein